MTNETPKPQAGTGTQALLLMLALALMAAAVLFVPAALWLMAYDAGCTAPLAHGA